MSGKAMLLAVVLSLSFSPTVQACGSGSSHSGKHHNLAQFVLNHASALSLTTAQESQLKALRGNTQQNHAQKQASGKGQTYQQIAKILTPAQMTTLQSLLKQAHRNHNHKAA